MPQRYFVEQLNHKIIGQDAHHIHRVMRMKKGDSIIVCHQGRCFDATLDLVENEINYTIQKEIKQKQTIKVTLVQGLPKHPKTEFIAKYATLFGVSAIFFIPMKRSIAKVENTPHKLSRLNAIAKEAAELSHRFLIPDIRFMDGFDSLDFKAYDLILLADEECKEQTLESICNQQHYQSIMLIIGPEGGISNEERNSFISIGAHPMTLGEAILPTEAAALHVLARLLA
jgi:16S rRNA (uracil1498-N3)-methyltransferase